MNQMKQSVSQPVYIENHTYRLCRKKAIILVRNWSSSALNHLLVKTMDIISILYLIYHYRENGTLTPTVIKILISFDF